MQQEQDGNQDGFSDELTQDTCLLETNREENTHFLATGIDPKAEQEGKEKNGETQAAPEEEVGHLVHTRDGLLKSWVVRRTLNECIALPVDTTDAIQFFHDIIQVLVRCYKEGCVSINSCVFCVSIKFCSRMDVCDSCVFV